MTDAPRPDDADDDAPTASGPSLPAELVGPGRSPLADADPDAEDDAPFDLGDLLGSGGLDLGTLMEQASQMQQQVVEAQHAAAATVVEGVSGGGAVRIEVTGAGEFRTVRIDPAAVDPDDVAMLEDLVLAALTDAGERVKEVQSQGLGGFGDLLGGAGL